MKLGIGSYAYAWSAGVPGAVPESPLDAFDLLDCAAKLGVSVVQYGPNLPLEILSNSEYARLVDRARERNIQFELGTRGLDIGSLEHQIELAKQAGATVLRWSVDKVDGVSATIDQVAACIDAIHADLARAGLCIAIENSRIPAHQLAQFVAARNSPWVGITLDTVNSIAIPEGSAAVVESLAPFVASLHIKDFEISRVWHRMGFIVEGRPAGRGKLDIPKLLDSMQRAPRAPNAILELWPPEQKTLKDTIALEHEWVAESISYLRRYIPN